MPTATSIGRVVLGSLIRFNVRQLAGIVLRELPCHAARARSALQGPLQGFEARGLDLRLSTAEASQPVADDVEVIVLLERIERQPQAEALRQRDLLFHRLARMQV